MQRSMFAVGKLDRAINEKTRTGNPCRVRTDEKLIDDEEREKVAIYRYAVTNQRLRGLSDTPGCIFI